MWCSWARHPKAVSSRAMAKIKEDMLKQQDNPKVELSQLLAKATGSTAPSSPNPSWVTSSPLTRSKGKTSGNSTRARYKPLDLLPKQTRAMCSRLTKHKEKLRPRNSRGRKGIVCCAGVWSRPEVVTAIKHQTGWKKNKDVTTSKSGQEKLGKI